MRIMHLLLSAGFAGTERATAEMCNAHAGEHEVLLVIRRGHRRRGASIRDYLSPAVQVVEVSGWWPTPGIRAAVARFCPDVIHTHLRRATRLIVRIDPAAATIGTLHMWVNGPHFLGLDGLIVIADWQKRDLAGYPGRVYEINESLLPHRRLEQGEIERLRTELGAGPGDVLIGGVGRLAKSKGFDLLISAFRGLGLPNAKLVLIGDGRERRRLEGEAGGQVRFTGFRADVKDCFQALDLFVSPSRSEPLGRVVLEALDAGVPVIATECEGPKQILAAYPGTLVPVGDVAALSRAIAAFVAAPAPRQRPDLSPYHLDTVARRTLAAYEELCRDPDRLGRRASRRPSARP